jgi:Tol biopolymer transport system component
MSQQTRACARPARPLKHNALRTIALTLLGLSCFAPSARAASDEMVGDTFPASITPAGEFAEGGTGEATSISGDGRYVTFLSAAENLGETGPPGVKEAYVKDLHTGALELVSRESGVDGEPASNSAQALRISEDGRYVIFSSSAPNLLEGASAEEGVHVYRRDLETGETALVDRVSGAKGAIVTGEAYAEAISADGRYVVFSADVEDLENPAGAHSITTGLTLYVRDMQTDVTTAVGRASGTSGAIANEPGIASSISPDGRYIAFESAATNLVPGMSANTVSQVYLRDVQTDTTTLISKTAPSEAAPAGEPGNASSEGGKLVGANGCEVAFDSEASNLYSFEGQPLATAQVYLTNLCATPLQSTLVSRADGPAGAPAGEGNSANPRVSGASADGRYILFNALGSLLGEDTNTSEHLYLRDLETGETTLVDRATGSAGADASSNPEGSAISANGCRAVFDTKASKLVEPEPLITERETYVRQLAACNEEPTMAPTSIEFGAQPLDAIGAAQTITVTAGSEALQIKRVQVSGTNPSDFIVTGDECTGETLQPEEKCTFTVRFVPGARRPRSASLTLHTAPTTSLEVNLTGEGTQLPSGAMGAAGVPGKEGSQGAPGRQGPVGGKGARGPAGRSAKVTCKIVEKAHRVRCSVTFKGKKSSRHARARLTMSGHVYALGLLADLHLARTIRRGTYMLSTIIDGRAVTVPVRLL